MLKFQIPEELHIYNIDNIADILKNIGDIPIISNTKEKKTKLYNIPCSFDIETSSFDIPVELHTKNKTKVEYKKCACLTCWSFCILNFVVFGRTWDELHKLFSVLEKKLKLSTKKRLVIYCHNLQYEFQWIRKRFEWFKVFSIDLRKPIYAVTTTGFEFRCSLILSGYKLETVGKNLTKYKVFKQVGFWDYNKIRHTQTVLDPNEVLYSCYDVLVVCAYIQECIEKDGNISKIPYTKTGYVRNDVRNNCLNTEEWERQNYQRFYYSNLMQGLTIEPDELELLQDVFQGGFTHANPNHANKIMYNVDSDDFTSAYPYAAVAFDGFPVSKGQRYDPKTKDDFEKQIRLYACVFEVYFENIKPKYTYDFYISSSHCPILEGARIANGRVESAARLSTTVTNIDYEIIRELYEWDEATFKIGRFYRYRRGYLPTEIVKSILTYYEAKTTLKGVEGKEIEYLAGKENVNSIYGMMAQAIIRPNYTYSDDWDEVTKPDLIEALEKYNNNKGRFTTYAWAPFLTAFCRLNLWSGIFELKDDYIYSDTDSLKYKNRQDHVEYFKRYNERCIELLDKAMKFHNLPKSMYKPKTVKGVEKPLGVWDWETENGVYTRFKTLGAKRYIYENDSGIHITVAGLSKQIAVEYLCKDWYYTIDTKEEINSPFDMFVDGLYIPPEYTGKQIHTYIDEPIDGVVADHNGLVGEFHELSCINLSPCDYHLGLQAFLEYIAGLQEVK